MCREVREMQQTSELEPMKRDKQLVVVRRITSRGNGRRPSFAGAAAAERPIRYTDWIAGPMNMKDGSASQETYAFQFNVIR